MNKILQPAKQQRSRDTQDRILRATEKLLQNEPFESISVRRIIKEAKTTIGSFYARFRDKDALLPVLYAEYQQQLQTSLVQLQDAVSQAVGMDAVAELAVQHFVDTYGEIPNLSRALYDHVTRSPREPESRNVADRRYRQYSFLFDALLEFRSEIVHPDPPRAVELAVYFMVVACRNRLLYPQAPQTRKVRITKQELVPELVRLLTGYLRN